MNRLIWQISSDENGLIQNHMDPAMFLQKNNKTDMMPDVFFAFLLKTMIDDFGNHLSLATQNRINKEQFEAALLDNLADMIPSQTRTTQL